MSGPDNGQTEHTAKDCLNKSVLVIPDVLLSESRLKWHVAQVHASEVEPPLRGENPDERPLPNLTITKPGQNRACPRWLER